MCGFTYYKCFLFTPVCTSESHPDTKLKIEKMAWYKFDHQSVEEKEHLPLGAGLVEVSPRISKGDIYDYLQMQNLSWDSFS